MSALVEGSPYQGYVYSYPHKTAHRPLAPPRPLAEVWAGERREALHLYLHVPFCEMRCGFCNLFTTTGAADTTVARYLDTLERQAEVVAEAIGPAHFARLAIGGGTPTLLAPEELERLLALATRLGAPPDRTAASVETSPKTVTPEKLALLRAAGVRRVSMGVQSFDERDTRALGRSQNRAELDRALAALKDARFEVLNLDLMYGAEGQTVEAWLASVRAALAWEPEELFLYPLYVRRLTALGTKMRAADRDVRLDQYRAARELLAAHGYEPWSMRLFRRRGLRASPAPEYRCQEDGMVGLGCGARSYTDALHYSTPYAVGRSAIGEIIEAWIDRPSTSFAVADYGIELDRDDRLRRFVVMSLLFRDGLDLRRHEERFGRPGLDELPQLAELVELQLARVTGGHLTLTERGIERSDAIGPWLASPQMTALMEGFAWR